MENLILEIAATIITSLVGYIALWVRRRFSIEIEARHREALHSAILSGVEAALRKGPRAALEVVVDEAVEHAKASVPDAVRYLAPRSSVLRTIAQRYAQLAVERLGGTTPRTP